ncbi:hypothetical protein [Brevibacterium marinum]|uniref:Uncharacterized protein n=1 Tax=Brevibacterium marinum TaxID=418643 RepID=A0A846RZD2_9MICO|nr:hypothetical protein [Brevibacterium marinum]NJC56805.1 hypothetical protein [Brevibacterium marinum]
MPSTALPVAVPVPVAEPWFSQRRSSSTAGWLSIDSGRVPPVRPESILRRGIPGAFHGRWVRVAPSGAVAMIETTVLSLMSLMAAKGTVVVRRISRMMICSVPTMRAGRHRRTKTSHPISASGGRNVPTVSHASRTIASRIISARNAQTMMVMTGPPRCLRMIGALTGPAYRLYDGRQG